MAITHVTAQVATDQSKCLNEFFVRDQGPNHWYTFDGVPLYSLRDSRYADKKFTSKT